MKPPATSISADVVCCSLGYLSYFISKAVSCSAGAAALGIAAVSPDATPRDHALIHRYWPCLRVAGYLPLGVYRIAEIAGFNARWPHAGGGGGQSSRIHGWDSVVGSVPSLGRGDQIAGYAQPMYALLANYFDLVSLDRHSLIQFRLAGEM